MLPPTASHLQAGMEAVNQGSQNLPKDSQAHGTHRPQPQTLVSSRMRMRRECSVSLLRCHANALWPQRQSSISWENTTTKCAPFSFAAWKSELKRQEGPLYLTYPSATVLGSSSLFWPTLSGAPNCLLRPHLSGDTLAKQSQTKSVWL